MSTPPTIRPYAPADEAACLALFGSNCPPAFDPAERALFERYLAAGPPYFWVLEAAGTVRACGGYGSRDEGQSWELYWGMVDRTRHGQGLGRQLLEFRIRHLRARYPQAPVISRISQYSHGFFARQGFVLHYVEENFWGPGLHLYDMSLAPA